MNFYAQCLITILLFYIPINLYLTNRIPPTAFYAFVAALLLISAVLPLFFFSCSSLQRGILYFHFLDRPETGVLNNPERVGIRSARNFYVQNGHISIGTWHILPKSYDRSTNRTDVDFERSLSNGEPIILYIHGNIGSRATAHRLELYKILQSLNYHVITFDFRSFGDSTPKTPNERDVVSDCMAVAEWLVPKIGSAPLFLWGHSLGTGMTTNVAAKLSNKGFECNGVILEAPFDNMPSEIREHPFGTVFRIFPWYNRLFSQPYYTNGEDFLSSNYILQFGAPVMIVHAEDDRVIPSKLGLKLYSIGLQQRKKNVGPMSIYLFDAQRKFGHTGMIGATEMPDIIRSFIDKYKTGTSTLTSN